MNANVRYLFWHHYEYPDLLEKKRKIMEYIYIYIYCSFAICIRIIMRRAIWYLINIQYRAAMRDICSSNVTSVPDIGKKKKNVRNIGLDLHLRRNKAHLMRFVFSNVRWLLATSINATMSPRSHEMTGVFLLSLLRRFRENNTDGDNTRAKTRIAIYHRRRGDG